MKYPEKRIVDFINEHHVLTLATSNDNIPWCANCFYKYVEEDNVFVFTSDKETKHVQDANLNPEVAGSIVLETKIIGKIQGIQFRGSMKIPEEGMVKKFKKAYLKKFPVAALMNTTIWVLKPNYIKMTDNRLGFGKKLIWEE